MALTGCAAGAGAQPHLVAATAEVGQCRNFTYQDATRFSEASAPVPCDGPHKAQTFSVVQLPDSDEAAIAAYWERDETAGTVASPGAGESTEPAPPYLRARVGACRAVLDRLIGWQEGDIPHRFEVNWFGPSRESWAQGDRTLRCDAVLPAGERDAAGAWQSRLTDLPSAPLDGYLTGLPALAWASCTRFDATTERVLARGACQQGPDVYIEIAAAQQWDDAAAWPGPEEVQRAAAQWCLDTATEAGFGEHRRYESWPTEAGWTGGSRWARCHLHLDDWNGWPHDG